MATSRSYANCPSQHVHVFRASVTSTTIVRPFPMILPFIPLSSSKIAQDPACLPLGQPLLTCTLGTTCTLPQPIFHISLHNTSHSLPAHSLSPVVGSGVGSARRNLRRCCELKKGVAASTAMPAQEEKTWNGSSRSYAS